MANESIERNELEGNLTRENRRFLLIWATTVALLYVVGGYLGIRQIRIYNAETESARYAQIKAITEQPPPGGKQTTGPQPTLVTVGTYVYRIGDFSLKEGTWTSDFDIWFRWTGNKVSPGKTFQVANAQVDSRELTDAYSKGQEHYERYHVKAHITQQFDVSRFPFSDEGLAIQVEDRTHDIRSLRYVADKPNSGYSRDGEPHTFRIVGSLAGVTQRVSGSSLGDPRAASRASDAHSIYVFLLFGSPLGARLFIALFQALYAAVAIGLLAAFIKPMYGDGRFGLGVGAFFAAVGNNIAVSQIIPLSDRITLGAMVNALGLATITISVVQSVISLYYYDTGREKMFLVFDKVTFLILLLGYLIISLLLPLAARY